MYICAKFGIYIHPAFFGGNAFDLHLNGEPDNPTYRLLIFAATSIGIYFIIIFSICQVYYVEIHEKQTGQHTGQTDSNRLL